MNFNTDGSAANISVCESCRLRHTGFGLVMLMRLAISYLFESISV